MNHEDIKKLENEILESIAKATDSVHLENLRLKYLSRKGEITNLFEKLKDLGIEEKRKLGPVLNEFKNKITNSFDEVKDKLEHKITNNFFDYTRPGKEPELGSLLPNTIMEREISNAFSKLGFEIVEGPEVESEYYNFDALNIPAGHPARDLWDTFWLPKDLKLDDYSKLNPQKALGLLLRTHTSPNQMRYMEKNTPPIKIIVPGTCYRYEATDARHEFQFKQIEALMIDKNISLANFKYIMHEVVKQIFGKEIKTRFLPSYFPFVSPGLQMDISCFKCNGKNKNCDLCHGSGWLEVMGAGMVHKELYRHAGVADYDYQGFAFGLGIERFAMVKYGINDIRLFNSGDLRFTKQF